MFAGAQGATALRVEGGGIALWAMRFVILLRRMENRTTGLRPLEMHPYRWLAPPLPPEGEVLAALYNELLKLALKKAESRLPPFGRSTAAGGDRGAFPSPEGRSVCFPSPARAVVWFYTNWRPFIFKRRHTTAFAP